MLATTTKTYDKRDRAIKAAVADLGSDAKEGVDYELSKDENKRWVWTRLIAPIAPKLKDRVYDQGAPNVIGTVTVIGTNACEVKWDKPEPWGAKSNTINKYLRFAVVNDDIPEALKVANRKPLTPEQESKFKEIQSRRGEEGKTKVDTTLPRNIEPAGWEILKGQKEGKRASGSDEKPSVSHRLRLLIIKNPKWNVDELLKKIESEGYTNTPRSTVGTFRSDTRATMKALVEAGMLDVEL